MKVSLQAGLISSSTLISVHVSRHGSVALFWFVAMTKACHSCLHTYSIGNVHLFAPSRGVLVAHQQIEPLLLFDMLHVTLWLFCLYMALGEWMGLLTCGVVCSCLHPPNNTDMLVLGTSGNRYSWQAREVCNSLICIHIKLIIVH